MGSAVLSLETDAIFLVDADTLALVAVNRGFSRLLGHESEDAAKLGLAQVLPDARATVEGLRAELAAHGSLMFGVVPLKHEDGRSIELELRAGVTSAAGKSAYCFVGRELGEIQRAEAAARASAWRCRILAESAFEAIAITEGGRIVDGNAQLESMLGAPIGELV